MSLIGTYGVSFFRCAYGAQRKNETPKEEKYHMKIVVIGGGSTYTPELIDGFIARAGVLGLQEIWLVDPNQERLAVVATGPIS